MDIKKYKSCGFTIARKVFNPHEVVMMRAACDELWELARNFHEDSFIKQTFFGLQRLGNPFDQENAEKIAQKGVLSRVTYPYLVSDIFDKMRTQRNLMEKVVEILGENVSQIVNQVNFNSPGKGKGWGWHQDYRFRKAGIEDMKNNFVQTLTALDKCSVENGGLRLVADTDHLSLALDQDPNTADSYIQESNVYTPILNPGDVVFFNPYVIHGSTANQSNEFRRVFINGFANTEKSSTGLPVLKDAQIIPLVKGQMEYEGENTLLSKSSKY